MRVLVTGAAGFIGFHVARALLERGDDVVGVDNLNDYYDVGLKRDRLGELAALEGAGVGNWTFHKEDLADLAAVRRIFEAVDFDRVIHLAAQAGVRYSMEAPHEYVDSNVVAFVNVLEGCRHHGVAHLTYASTSSVYGANSRLPFSERDHADHPLQLYAATKRANELMAHSYSHLFALPTTGLRFFTVYGPWGRPDMALFRFADQIVAGEAIDVFNHGRHRRDFTYIDDIAEGVLRASDQIATGDDDWDSGAPNPATSSAPFRLFNIGNNEPVELMDYIAALEQALGRTARLNMLPMQPGDVVDTHADVSALEKAVGYRPRTSVADGVSAFAAWYLSRYGN